MRQGVLVSLVLAGVLAIGVAAQASAPEGQIKLQFVTFMRGKMPEQDVFIEKAASSDGVYRTTSLENPSAPLYASAIPVPENPFNPKDLGPYQKGRALGITLGQWLAATGSGTLDCRGGAGTLNATFTKLVPNGVYTVWYHFGSAQPTSPALAFDLPLGAIDGTQNIFRSDEAGNASFKLAVKPCLQLSGDYVAAVLAIAWHSDGKTYGIGPGPMGQSTHVQLLVELPKARGL